MRKEGAGLGLCHHPNIISMPHAVSQAAVAPLQCSLPVRCLLCSSPGPEFGAKPWGPWGESL